MNRKNLKCSYLKNIIRKNTLHFYRFLGSGLRVFDQSRQITSSSEARAYFRTATCTRPYSTGVLRNLPRSFSEWYQIEQKVISEKIP